jgi:hypothetical protein
MQAFLTMKEHEWLSQVRGVDQWAFELAYLSDIVVHLNELNRKIQGKNENILSSVDKTQGFRVKLKLWVKLIAKRGGGDQTQAMPNTVDRPWDGPCGV